MHLEAFGWIALAGAALSALVILWFLVARPQITRTTKIALLFGIGVFPLMTAGSGNYAGFEATKAVKFCGSCHVMTPYKNDAQNPKSNSLAAIHTRTAAFGHESCYTCHADYGMFGTIKTKMGGMGHVYEYLFNFHQLTLDEAIPKIHLKKPFQSTTCMRCHTTSAPGWGRRARSASGSRTATGPAGASSATVTGASTFIFCTLAGWASSAGR